MATVAEVQAKLTADTSQFTAAFHEAERLMGSLMSRMGGLEGLLSKGFTIAAIAKVGEAIFEATERAAKYAEELEQISTITGVATNTLQDWSVVLNRVGMGVQDVAGMTRILSRNIEEAKNGTQEAIDKFSRLGITIDETSESEQVIRQIADSMSHMGSATERAAAATELLGRGGQRAINFLAKGSAAFDEAAEAAARMGKLTEAQIATLSATDDALDDVGKSWEGLSNQIGAIFAPAVKVAAQALTFVLNETQIAIQKIWLRFTDLLSGISSFTQQVINLGKGVFSGEIFTSAGRDAIIQRAKAIIDEESAVRDLIRADHELVGTAEQYKKVTEEKTQAARRHTTAIKDQKEQLDLYIKGLVSMGEEERARQAMLERARITSGGVQIERAQAIIASAQTFSDSGIAAMVREIVEADRAMTEDMVQNAMHRKSVAEDEQYALNELNQRMQQMNREEADLWNRLSMEIIQDQRTMTDETRAESLHREAIRSLAEQRSNDQLQKSMEFENRLWDQRQVAQYEMAKAQKEKEKELFTTVFTSINSAFDTVVQGVLLGTQTMSQGIKRLGVDIAASLGKELIAKPITKALGEMITSSMASGLLGQAGSFASGLLPAGVTAGGLGMAAGIGGGALGLAGLAGAFSGGSRGRDFWEGMGNIWTFGLAGAFDVFGGDERNRKRNEQDFINGTVQAAKDFMGRLTTANTPQALQQMLGNGNLPGPNGGSFGNITASFGSGGVLGGASIGFQSMGQFRYLAGQMDAAGQQFVKALQDSVDLIIKAFNDANEKIVSQLVGLAQQTAIQAATSQEFLLKRTQINQAIQQQIDSAHADMIGMTDPTQLSNQVSKIQTLLQQRYNGEIQMVQTFVAKMQQAMAAWKGLTSTIDEQLAGLRLNRFGAPTPEAQLAFDQGRFTSALTSFRTSRTASAGAMVSDLASPFLTAAAALAGGDMTSASYQATWQTVVDALEEVRQTSIDETAKLNNDMLAALGEQTTLENLIQQNTKRMADSLDNLRIEAAAQFRAMGFNIPQFAEGTDFVPKTGLALVHRGEEIIPVGGRSSRGLVVQVSGNTFVGTEQSMLRDLASKIQPYINSNPSL